MAEETTTVRLNRAVTDNLLNSNPSDLPDSIWYGLPLGRRVAYMVTLSSASNEPQTPDQD